MDGRVVSVSLLALAVFVAFRRRRGVRGATPPGPPQIPIIGNILPVNEPWEALRLYALQYGAFYVLRVLSTNIFVVNTVEAASELCETRWSSYSQRIPMKMPELSGMNEGILFETNPLRLRQARRLVALGIGPRELDKYRSQLRTHVVSYLGRLLEDPDEYRRHIRNLPISMMLEIAYGYKSQDDDDPFVLGAKTLVENYAEASSLSNYIVSQSELLVARVPSWVPGAGFQRKAAAWKDQANDITEKVYRFTTTSIAEDTAIPSVVSKALESHDPYEKHVIAKSAMQMVSGGADTTISTITTFVLAMVLYPEVQKKAQAEIDKVVGLDRLPVFGDREDLPYIDALLRELLRWHPPIPTVPRTTTKDDVYEGYFIPEGSFVLINFWAMLCNEEVFLDAKTLKPERWLGVEVTKEIDPLFIAFGFGRRECPAKVMAVELVFTVMIHMLAVFDISKARDAQGIEITPSETFDNGSICAPLPFPCTIKPRSVQHAQVLQQNLEALK
ncbi:hypothetical protein EIP91_009423 [Steccherinum ochraceum]|uniref:Cytochrome P450 n=1 Tax=Steccherinum ochraceum TaxID=92696 RepID=A0A4R0REG7_9APHY|nr:hypothetical protein EIP91_009423 [Steccherinum ochraceum]